MHPFALIRRVFIFDRLERVFDRESLNFREFLCPGEKGKEKESERAKSRLEDRPNSGACRPRLVRDRVLISLGKKHSVGGCWRVIKFFGGVRAPFFRFAACSFGTPLVRFQVGTV